jgi:hypothetical protein
VLFCCCEGCYALGLVFAVTLHPPTGVSLQQGERLRASFAHAYIVYHC